MSYNPLPLTGTLQLTSVSPLLDTLLISDDADLLDTLLPSSLWKKEKKRRKKESVNVILGQGTFTNQIYMKKKQNC